MNKLGKLPARANSIKLKLSRYVAVSPPPSEKAVNLNWQMLGNDTAGDCVVAGGGHETMAWNNEAGKQVAFSAANTIKDYSSITGYDPKNPNTDQGTDMQVAASYRRKTGLLDASGKKHQVAAYVALAPGNKAEIKQAIYLFGAVGIGIKFPQSAMAQFDAGKNWTIVSKSPIEGGHYVPAVGYDSRYVYVVTWGKLTKATWGFLNKYMDEGVAYLSYEMLNGGKSLEGFDAPTLTADLGALK
jgi:hypothetical protein